MRTPESESAPRGLDRLLPSLLGEAPELRPRARALVRAALWTATWAVVVAAILREAGRAQWAALVGLSALGAMATLPRLLRSADLPASASWLGWNALFASFAGALGTGGPGSPVVFAAAITAATSAACANAHGVATALLVPAGLFAARYQGWVAPPLEGVLADGVGLATLALVAGAAGELLVAERAARGHVKARALRQGMLSTEVLQREVATLRSLVEHAPIGVFVVDPDGRIGASPSRALETWLGENPSGAELIGLLARAGDPDLLRSARSGLSAWARAAPPSAVLPAFPTRLPWRGGTLELAYGPVVGPEGRLERVVVAVRPAPEAPLLPAEHQSSAEVLARCAARADGGRAELRFGAEPLAIPDRIVGVLEEALEALIENALLHGLEPEAMRVSLGKPARGQIELRAGRRGRGIVFSVSDDGRGIDWARVTDEAHARGWPVGGRREREAALTAPGFSTAGRPGGGLAQARAAAEGLGGSLVIEASARGEGTTVEIHLPDPIPSRPRSGSKRRLSPAPPRA